jgi:AraC-like DNA-binding protein
VSTAKFSRMLQGRSRFRRLPIACSPLGKSSAKRRPGWIGACWRTPTTQAIVAALKFFLRERRPVPDDNIEIVRRIAAQIAVEPQWTRVEQVAHACDMGVRSLRRLFGEYVGVSPKWVIQRYRLHEAAARIAATATPDWADLALSLGYANQAHFIRDFKKLVGTSPADYRKALSRRP